MSYRYYKFNFTAFPIDSPALWTYSLNMSTPTVYYISWNGATEVAKWNFYASSHLNASFALVGNILKSGFETKYTSSVYHPWSFAEALAANGTSLADSTIQSTWVPPVTMADSCNEMRCPGAHVLPNETEPPTAAPNRPGRSLSIWWLVTVVSLASFTTALTWLIVWQGKNRSPRYTWISVD